MLNYNPAQLQATLVQDEGRRLMPYKDTRGFITIGVGRNLSAKGITSWECDVLLGNDINTVVVACEETYAYLADLDRVRTEVVLNMAFNLGMAGLAEFKEMHSAIERGDYAEAAVQMKASNWYLQVGARAVRLAEEMQTGMKKPVASGNAMG